jgi:hypothetical protein
MSRLKHDVYPQSSILLVYVTFVVILDSVSTGCLHLYRFCVQNKVTGSMVVSSDSAPMALQSGVMRVMKGMSFCIQMATTSQLTLLPHLALCPCTRQLIPLHLQFKRYASRTLRRHALAAFRLKFRFFFFYKFNFITKTCRNQRAAIMYCTMFVWGLIKKKILLIYIGPCIVIRVYSYSTTNKIHLLSQII